MSFTLAGATALGAGLSAGGGLISNLINRKTAKENLAFQREANAQNIALTREMNDQNIAFQREANAQNISLTREINNQNIAFQQNENSITRQREDNAVQRAAADMQAAGLSKTLAAGNPASAAALTAPSANTPQVKAASVKGASVQALNNQFKYESALQKLNLGSLLLDMAAKEQQLEINKGVADAQIANLGSQTAHQNLVNDSFMEQFGMEKSFKFAQTRYYNVQSEGQEAQNVLVRKYGASKAVSEINVLAAQRANYNAQALLTTKNVEKAAFEISKIVAETYNLGKQGEKLAFDVAYAQLQNQALQHNIGYADRMDLPVGATPNGYFGSMLTFANSFAQNIVRGLGLSGLFGFGSKSTGSGGGNAW